MVEGHDCLAIYEYNDFIKEIIFRIKAQGDINLAYALMLPIKNFIKTKYQNFTIIPMPSSSKSNFKRGFNHVEEMFSVVGLKMVKAFIKKNNYKQSNQSKFHRKDVENHIIFRKELINIKNNYLIVDDITTTHQTIAYAIRKLYELGVKNVKTLIVCIKERKV